MSNLHPVRLFGRDPALVVNLLGWLLVLLSTFVLHLSTDVEAAVNAVLALVVGLVVAVIARDGQVAAILGLFKGLLVLALALHFNITPDKQFILYSALAAIIAAFTRTQVTAPLPPPPIPALSTGLASADPSRPYDSVTTTSGGGSESTVTPLPPVSNASPPTTGT